MLVHLIGLLPFLLSCSGTDKKDQSFSTIYDFELAFLSESNLIQKIDFFHRKKNITDGEFLYSLKEEHSQIGNDSTSIKRYVGVPINAYRMIKRLTIDRDKFTEMLNQDEKEEIQNYIKSKQVTGFLPTDDDMTLKLESLVRIQSLYNLETASLYNGVINNVKYSRELTGVECFELAEHFYLMGAFYLAFQWFDIASLKLVNGKANNKETEILTEDANLYKIDSLHKWKIIKKIIMHEHFFEECTDMFLMEDKLVELNKKYSSQLHNYDLSLTFEECRQEGLEAFAEKNWIHTILWMFDATTRVDVDNLLQVDDLIKAAKACVSLENYYCARNFLKLINKDRIDYEVLILQNYYKKKLDNVVETVETKMNLHECEVYSKICRGVVLPKSEELNPLRCKYFNNKKDAFLLLAPFQMEEINIQPYIVYFHNIVSDDEIKFLKGKSLNSSDFEPSYVYAEDMEFKQMTRIRTSKNTWLSDDDETVKRISIRVQDITKANITIAEQWQLANYGPGGHYVPHHDFLEDLNAERLATFMIYLSDVEEGGKTAFPLLDVFVSPKKGSAVLWYNLHNGGKPDYETYHAGCPVIVGSKWIANKWIVESPNFCHFHERF